MISTIQTKFYCRSYNSFTQSILFVKKKKWSDSFFFPVSHLSSSYHSTSAYGGVRQPDIVLFFHYQWSSPFSVWEFADCSLSFIHSYMYICTTYVLWVLFSISESCAVIHEANIVWETDYQLIIVVGIHRYVVCYLHAIVE